jgi:hypothetical protein
MDGNWAFGARLRSAMKRRLPRIIRNRLKGLKYLSYAVFVLVLIPCVVEFCLRVAACRQNVAQSSAEPAIEIVPSWTMHHQLKPMQTLTLRDPAADIVGVSSESTSSDDEVSTDDAPDVSFRTNSHGIRGAELSVPKPRGVFRIVCIGDELTLAPHLSEEDTFCEQLALQLKDRSQLRIEVVNAAIPDFCPLLSYIQLRHRLLSLEPDLVILQLSPNDVIDDGIKRRQTELGLGDIPLASIHPQLLATPKTKPLSEHFLSWKLAENSLAVWLTKKPRAKDDRVLVEASISSPSSVRVSRQDAVMMLNPVDHMVESVTARRCAFVLSLPPLTADAWMRINEDSELGQGSKSSPKAKNVLDQVLAFSESRQFVVCNSTIKPPANGATSYRSSKMSAAQHRFHAGRLAETILTRTPGPWTSN